MVHSPALNLIPKPVHCVETGLRCRVVPFFVELSQKGLGANDLSPKCCGLRLKNIYVARQGVQAIDEASL